MIGHEITAFTGLDHGQTLAVVFPGMMAACKADKKDKLLQFAERVWGIHSGSDDEKIDAAIAKTRAFFESVGVHTHLKDYAVDGLEVAGKIAQRFEQRGWNGLGERQKVGPRQVGQILSYSL
jgi:NADP-dependent alcohol dehydrogenase